MKTAPTYLCIHDATEPVHPLRWRDDLSALREIRARGVRDWGWTLPTSFNLCIEDEDGDLSLVCSAQLTADGIVL